MGRKTIEKTRVRDTGSWAARQRVYLTGDGPALARDTVISHWCVLFDGKELSYAGETAVPRMTKDIKCKWCSAPVPKEIKFILRMCEIHEKL